LFLWSSFRDEFLWLARRVPEMRLGRGQILYGPTQESRSIFMMLKGGLRPYKMLGAAELTLKIVEAGHPFGDLPALAGRVRRDPRSLARGHPPAPPSIEIVTERLPLRTIYGSAYLSASNSPTVANCRPDLS
jgi:hypothetical protein